MNIAKEPVEPVGHEKMGGTFTLNKEKRMTLEPFLCGKDVFAPLKCSSGTT